MFDSMLTKMFSIGMAIVAFFCNFVGSFQKPVAPDGAITVKYGKGACEYYDMYIPEDAEGEVDVLLAIHGGAWIFGKQNEFDRNCEEASKLGYVAVTMDYDKFQNGKNAHQMVNEIDAAIASIKTELEKRGLKADKLALTGHSAGSHLATLYAYSRYKTSPIEIGFLLANCTPCEFLGDAKAETTTMGEYAHILLTALTGKSITDKNIKKMKKEIDSVTPLHFVSKDVPPTIVVHGNADKMVPYKNSVDLFNALQENGVDSEFITYEGASHFLGAEFEEENSERAAAFFRFAEKYL